MNLKQLNLFLLQGIVASSKSYKFHPKMLRTKFSNSEIRITGLNVCALVFEK